MKLAIIGLTGAGKSTIFDALTGTAASEGGPKTETRIGTVPVPDRRIDHLTRLYQPGKTIYAQVEYLLPPAPVIQEGAKKDQAAWGLVRTCDALIHVLRNFSELGPPTPTDDFSRLDEEMMFFDLLVVEKRLERLELDRKRGRNISAEEKQLLEECRDLLEQEIPLRSRPELGGAQLLKGFTFLSAKPQLVLFNNSDDNSRLPEITGGSPAGERCQVIRGRLERELAQMSAEEAAEYLAEFEISVSAKDRIILDSYELLGLISFFTVGDDEVRAWTIRRRTPAVDAAEVIHSDIRKGFIRAEVLACDDLLAAGTHKEARKQGTVRLEGKTYEVKDGDIIEFRFNV